MFIKLLSLLSRVGLGNAAGSSKVHAASIFKL
jgi:hypothetical protein